MADTPKPNPQPAPPVAQAQEPAMAPLTTPSPQVTTAPRGFTRQNVLDLEKNIVIPQPPGQVQAAVPTTDGGYTLTSAKLDVSRIDFSKIDQKDFHKLVGTGIFDALPMALPDFLGFHIKDKNYIIVGVNRKAEDGTRIAQFKAAGYQFIQREELEEPIPFDIATGDPQGVTYKDLCFMKVLKRRHLENQEAIFQATQAQSGKKNLQRAMGAKAAEVLSGDGTTSGAYGNVFFIPLHQNENGPHSTLAGKWSK